MQNKYIYSLLILGVMFPLAEDIILCVNNLWNVFHLVIWDIEINEHFNNILTVQSRKIKTDALFLGRMPPQLW